MRDFLVSHFKKSMSLFLATSPVSSNAASALPKNIAALLTPIVDRTQSQTDCILTDLSESFPYLYSASKLYAPVFHERIWDIHFMTGVKNDIIRGVTIYWKQVYRGNSLPGEKELSEYLSETASAYSHYATKPYSLSSKQGTLLMNFQKFIRILRVALLRQPGEPYSSILQYSLDRSNAQEYDLLSWLQGVKI